MQIGVGPDRAREVTEWALRRFEIDHVVVSGIAGGLAADLPVGSVVVPETVIDIRSGERFTSAPLGGVERRGLMYYRENEPGVRRQLVADFDGGSGRRRAIAIVRSGTGLTRSGDRPTLPR